MLILCVPVLHQYQSIEKINHLETDEKTPALQCIEALKDEKWLMLFWTWRVKEEYWLT